MMHTTSDCTAAIYSMYLQQVIICKLFLACREALMRYHACISVY